MIEEEKEEIEELVVEEDDADSDIAGDDFDFEDIEEIDDNLEEDEEFLSDNDWDEYDEDDMPPIGEPVGQKPRSFIQKYFNVIVISIAVLIGIGIFAMQILPGSQKPRTTQTAQFQPPVEKAIAEIDAQNIADPLQIAEESQQEQILDIQVPEKEPEPEPVPKTEPQVLTPMPDEIFTENFTGNEVQTDNQAESEIAQPTEDTQTQQDDFDMTQDEQVITNLDQMPKPAIQQPDLITEANEKLEKELKSKQDLIDRFNSIISDMAQKLKTQELQIQTLSQQLDEAKKGQKVVVKEVIKEVEPVIAKAPKPIVTTQQKKQPIAAKPRETVKTVKIVKSAPKKWILRSAQPGMAMIAAEGSNDLRSVSVGDSVSGLGRIQSIAIENGKWVISGTKGSVYQ